MRTAFLYLLGSILLSVSAPAYSQVSTDTTFLWLVKTDDGNQYVGELLSQDQQEIRLRTRSLGDITIQNASIVSMEQVVPEQLSLPGRQRPPQSTRYFFSPNGYNLRQGEGYYQNTWVLLNQASVGVTDYFTIGAGTVPLFLFAGGATPVWITPKFSLPIQRDRINLGVGGLFATVLGEGGGAAGIAYGVSTFGSPDRNITFGLGYGFVDDEWADVPLITLAGTTRVSQRTSLLTENYFLDAGEDLVVIVSMGGRSMIGSSVSLDYGLVIPVTSEESFFALPWLSVTFPFGVRSN